MALDAPATPGCSRMKGLGSSECGCAVQPQYSPGCTRQSLYTQAGRGGGGGAYVKRVGAVQGGESRSEGGGQVLVLVFFWWKRAG